jgi:Tfp pilus assembly protein PilO
LQKMDSLFENFRQKQGLFLIIIFGLAALFFCARFILALQMERLDYTAEMLESQRKFLEGCRELEKDVRGLQAEIEKLTAEAAAVKSAIPSSEDLPALATQIYELLKKHRLEGDRIVIGELVAEENYNYFTLDFSAEGKRESILGFLADLERLQRKVSIIDLLLTSTGNDSFKVALQLEAYVLTCRPKKQCKGDN